MCRKKAKDDPGSGQKAAAEKAIGLILAGARSARANCGEAQQLPVEAGPGGDQVTVL